MGSSTLHIVISTSPFLVLFSYFLYASYTRPKELYNAAVNGEDVVIIPLVDMLHTTLISLVCWACLAVYTGIYVRRRRRLMKNYAAKNSQDGELENSIVITGDVYYNRPTGLWRILDKCSYTDTAYVTYRHPDGNAEDGSPRFVQKKIRTYHPYHREHVPILVLKDLPLSGQPKLDVERDIASFQSEYAIRNRDKIKQVVIVCVGWIIFSLATASYILYQINIVDNLNIQMAEEDRENFQYALKCFLIYTCGVLPVLAFGANALQWFLYHRWIIRGGKVVEVLTKVVPRVLQPDNGTGGGYVQMA